MSKYSESGVNNRVFSAVMATVAMALFALWFFIHPNSPWHSQHHYVARFDSIGTLVPGNEVQLNGVAQGKVLALELTDSCVWVQLEVLASAKIPNNSTFTIVNAGLMGERVVNIQLADSPQMLADGDTVAGHLDMGSTHLAMMVIATLREVNGLIQTGKNLVDTLLSPEHQARYSRISQKGRRLVRHTQGVVGDWNDSLQQLGSTLKEIQDQSTQLIQQLEPGVGVTVDSLKSLQTQILALRTPLLDVAQRASQLVDAVQTPNNSVGLVLQQDSLSNQLKGLASHADQLMQRIQKEGLNLNVDVW